MRDFDDIARASRSNERDAHTHEEAPTHKLVNVVRLDTSALKDDSNDDDRCSQEHAKSSAESVDGRANERDSYDSTDLGHGTDDAGLDSNITDIKEVQEHIVVE